MWHGEKEREVYELYSEDLDRLTLNSKPVISNLTELADEYKRDYAPLIVRIIEDRIKRVSYSRTSFQSVRKPFVLFKCVVFGCVNYLGLDSFGLK